MGLETRTEGSFLFFSLLYAMEFEPRGERGSRGVIPHDISQASQKTGRRCPPCEIDYSEVPPPPKLGFVFFFPHDIECDVKNGRENGDEAPAFFPRRRAAAAGGGLFFSPSRATCPGLEVHSRCPFPLTSFLDPPPSRVCPEVELFVTYYR